MKCLVQMSPISTNLLIAIAIIAVLPNAPCIKAPASTNAILLCSICVLIRYSTTATQEPADGVSIGNLRPLESLHAPQNKPNMAAGTLTKTR